MKILTHLLLSTLIFFSSQNVILKKKSDYKVNYDRQLSNIPDNFANKKLPGTGFIKDLRGYYVELDDMNKKIGYAKRFAFDELGRALGKLENHKEEGRKLKENKVKV